MEDSVHTYLINSHVKGFRSCATANEDGTYSIFIEASLTRAMQVECYWHELAHILNKDFDAIREGVSVDEIEYQRHQH